MRSRWSGIAAAAVLAALLAARSGAPTRTGQHPPFRFVESSSAAGLDWTHVPDHPLSGLPVLDRLVATGAGVAVVDYDGDGWMDVFVPGSGDAFPGKLFRNRRDGAFEDVTAKAGLRGLRGRNSRSALFVDLDADGRPDMVFCRDGRLELLWNRGGVFRKAEAGTAPSLGCSTVNAADLDGDGWLDLVVAGRRGRSIGDRHGRTDVVDFGYATSSLDPGPLTVLRNEKGRRFTPMEGGALSTDAGFANAIGVYDLRGTGRRDVYFAKDFSKDRVFLNAEGGLRNATPALKESHAFSGMSAAIADADNDGRPLVFVSNVYKPGYALWGNLLWKVSPDGRFQNVADDRGVRRCGWSWGARFVDLDGDGRLDLVVANGQISGDGRDFSYPRAVMTAAAREVQHDARWWPLFPPGGTISGHQRDCVFWNKEGRYVEVGEEAGIDRERFDGRGVAEIDARNDGTPGLLVANQAQPLRYYRVETDRPRRWVGFDLRGAKPNTGAWGAVVTVALDDGRRLTAEVEPANGYASQSDPRPRFSLGPAARVVSASVRWPDGSIQELGAVAPGRYREVRQRPAGRVVAK